MALPEIRLALASDTQDILAIDRRASSSGDAARVSEISGSIEKGQCLVHTSDDCTDGYVAVGPEQFFGRDFVELLVVAEQRRRLGIGQSLLSYVVSMSGTPQVFTSTNQSNQPMRALLDHAHWKFSGQLDGLDPADPELVYFMWRT